jgi:UDP-N-acetylmuramate--alanine ligase
MKGLDHIETVYFIGIGGIGMSALARYFLFQGKKVGGYDRVESELTNQLTKEGAAIHYEDNVNLIPEDFKDQKKETLIVYTPAVPANHSELNYFREHGFTVLKRSQLLGKITCSVPGICVAGTHGKTTTSSMIAHLLKQSHVDCSAFLGGILRNYDSNLMLSLKSDLVVIEADEYDRSFHTLSPFMAVITSATPDHLDIYETEEAYREAFCHFTSLIKEDGVLLLEKGVDIIPRLHPSVKFYTYSGDVNDLKKENYPDFYARNIRIESARIWFDFVTPEKIIPDIELGVPVEINIFNGVAAMAIAYLNGLTDDELRNEMKSFRGVKRRFDFHIKTDDLVLIDDYAHHPEELEASISSVKKLYPEKKLTVIFQPHLYSRTRDFQEEFARALSLADEVILIPIYPAREEPIPGVNSEMLLEKISVSEKQFYTKEELLENMDKQKREVILIAGAGDIELLVEPIKKKLYV